MKNLPVIAPLEMILIIYWSNKMTVWSVTGEVHEKSLIDDLDIIIIVFLLKKKKI